MSGIRLRLSRLRRSLPTLAFVAIAFLFVQTPLMAQFTGTWSGTYTLQDCDTTLTGQFAVASTQDGSSANGIASMEFKIQECKPIAPIMLQLPMFGTVSGSTLTGTIIFPDDAGPSGHAFTATVSGNSMTVQAGGGKFTATLTLTSASTPGGGASGYYSGPYTAVVSTPECKNFNSFTFTGTMGGSLTQAGDNLAGVVVLTEAKEYRPDSTGNCTQIAGPDIPILLTTVISGTSVTGSMIGGGEIGAVSATLSGNTLTGAWDPPPAHLTFSISKSSGTAPPIIGSFTADPDSIPSGGTTTLSWLTLNTTGVTIDNGVGTGPSSGSNVVQPVATTTYTLTANGPGGTATAKTTVTVSAPPPPPNVVISAFPAGMLQTTGSAPPTDKFTISNFGGKSTNVNLSRTGTFYTQSPFSFTLIPGASQVVVISASPQQPAGKYEGSTTASGNGFSPITVPVRLVVGDAPSSPVNVSVPITRSDITAPSGQNPSGSVSFTNPSSATIQGIVVADVPWIVVTTPGLTLGPQETKAVAFTIDRSKRPDGSTGAIGGAAGSLTYRYINAATGKATVLGTTITSNVSVSVVDVVTGNVTPAAPPALGQNEAAVFITGASSKFGFGDLALSNAGNANITDLKMYYSQAGSSASQVSSVGSFLAGAGISFPNVVKNIFNAASATGVVQLRSSQINNVSVFPTETRSTLGQSYVTALPVFRSTRGFASGTIAFLPGVRKTTTMSTTLYIQELLGSQTTTVGTDFIDADGNVVGTRSDNLTAFQSLELPDVVPTGAVTVRIRNTSSGTSNINAYALVIDAFTNDAFTVQQIGPITDPMFAPAFAAATGTRNVVLNLTNAGTSPITITATTVSGGARRRATSHSFGSSVAAAPSTVTIPPLAYRQITIPDTGFVRLTGGTALRVAGTFSSSKSGGSIGSGLSVLPTSRAYGADVYKRFSGIEDGSPADVAAARASTYRNNLMLIETSGAPLTVRLTLRYVFSAGVTVSAGAVNSRDFDLPAGGFLLIDDVVSSVIGSSRANFGTLHGVVMDVQGLSGTGKVIPFLQVIDNGTNDVTVRD